MRFGRLDLNLLVALDALIAERNVSIAAERLFLSQSAMSGALGRLREFFDDELLVNTGRKMVLTPRAEQLAEPVRAVLLQIKSQIATPPSFDPATSDRTFVIAASDYAIMVRLPAALRAIAAQAPHIRLEFQALDERLQERIERREIDLLLTIDTAMSPNHPFKQVFEDDFVVIGWSGNPHLANGLDLEIFQQLGHVAVQFGKARVPSVEDFLLHSQQVRRRVEIWSPSFTLVPSMVIGTNRIATVHRHMAEMLAEVLPLSIFPVPVEIPPIRQTIQWHRSCDDDMALRWIVEQFQSHAGEPQTLEALADS
ncbi:LysR family transcriptional regulator [Sphingomonas sp. AOB5]|uniref:LysR family transcriptional regulator n=1 Tax=Sphingomonas sp. AOB5 TaxID=3034017 RepID=UPI0023F91325|nr:LysR family transcriptional regulator [Sphingomonas sp. AOB5]MDF7776395.1 LysR family transcriptional regulator [Sphingomonas sp. AOB5]